MSFQVFRVQMSLLPSIMNCKYANQDTYQTVLVQVRSYKELFSEMRKCLGVLESNEKGNQTHTKTATLFVTIPSPPPSPKTYRPSM